MIQISTHSHTSEITVDIGWKGFSEFPGSGSSSSSAFLPSSLSLCYCGWVYVVVVLVQCSFWFCFFLGGGGGGGQREKRGDELRIMKKPSYKFYTIQNTY